MMTLDQQKTCAELFKKVCEKAKQESIAQSCTIHVNPAVSVASFDFGNLPYCSGFVTSDWHEPSTLASFTNGREH